MTALTLPVARDLGAWRRLRPRRGTLGFVPTMGALHEGHLSLVRRALAENDSCVVSIFVNPTQFDDPSDLAAYPKTFDADCAMLAELGGPLVLAPPADVLYADGYRVRVSEHVDALELEGRYRPGHFDGMLTVVLKLLNIARADRAYFGEKDFQQLRLVRTMVESLFHPTAIVGCATVREHDGLARSSRNRRLNAAQRELAGAWAALLADTAVPADDVVRRLEALGFGVDYVTERWGRRLGAVHVPTIDGGPEVRLIDNVALPDAGGHA